MARKKRKTQEQRELEDQQLKARRRLERDTRKRVKKEPKDPFVREASEEELPKVSAAIERGLTKKRVGRLERAGKVASAIAAQAKENRKRANKKVRKGGV